MSIQGREGVDAPGLLLFNARPLTMGGVYPGADAILVLDGRIAAIGPSNEIRQRMSCSFAEIDLEGRTVIPALEDSHTHFQKGAVQRAHYIDYLEIAPSSIAEVLLHVKTRVEQTPAGEWIRGDALN